MVCVCDWGTTWPHVSVPTELELDSKQTVGTRWPAFAKRFVSVCAIVCVTRGVCVGLVSLAWFVRFFSTKNY